jgi:hypothetical protein
MSTSVARSGSADWIPSLWAARSGSADWNASLSIARSGSTDWKPTLWVTRSAFVASARRLRVPESLDVVIPRTHLAARFRGQKE